MLDYDKVVFGVSLRQFPPFDFDESLFTFEKIKDFHQNLANYQDFFEPT